LISSNNNDEWKENMDFKIYDKDYLTIKEFSEFSGISVSTLQKYDRMGVLHPSMRGSGNQNGYRYYAPTQVTSAKMIRVLAEMDVPLETIKELMEDRTPEKLLKLLRKNKNIAVTGMRFYSEVHSVIDTFVGLLHDGISATESEIALVEMPTMQIILGGENNYTGTVGFMREYTRFCSSKHEPKLNTSFPIGGYWDSMEAFLFEPSRPSRFFSLDPKGHDQKAAGVYLVGYTRGYYGETNGLPEKIAAYAEANGLEFSGPLYNLYLLDEISITDPSQYLLQVSVLVTETGRSPSIRPHRHF